MSKWIPDPYFWKRRGLPEPVPEFRFHSKRRWKFDFVWDSGFQECEGVPMGTLVAVEINGGIFMRFGQGAHNRTGQIRDMEKLNEAQRLGYKVFQFLPVSTCGEKLRFLRIDSEKTAEFLRSVLT